MSLLCYLVQSPNGESYIESINDDLFEFIEFKLTSQLLKRYHKLKHRIPGELEATAFLEEEIKNTRDLPEATAKDLREVFEDIYIPLKPKDLQFVEDELIIGVQSKQLEVLSSRFAKGELTPEEFLKQTEPLAAMAVPGDDDTYKEGARLVADRYNNADDRIEGDPTFLHDLNMLTAAGGFYAPQLIIFMSGPKHFKTGLLIKTGVEYARNGRKVYYADGENGARSVRNRAKMAILECELRELFDGTISKEEINEALRIFGFYMGGELFIDSYPAGQKSVKDVKIRLAFLKEKYGFEPDLIVWDSLKNFVPSDTAERRRDPHIKSQIVYHEAINLNKELDIFAFGPSQVQRGAISKKVFSMGDIQGDFGKVMGAHAIFAICATDEELEPDEDGMSIRRIIPIAQREGVGYRGKNMCIVKIDEARMIIKEAEILEERVDDD